MVQPKKKPVRKAKKKKGKVTIHKSVKMRQKAAKSENKDTVPVQLPRSNGVVFKVKVKKK